MSDTNGSALTSKLSGVSTRSKRLEWHCFMRILVGCTRSSGAGKQFSLLANLVGSVGGPTALSFFDARLSPQCRQQPRSPDEPAGVLARCAPATVAGANLPTTNCEKGPCGSFR